MRLLGLPWRLAPHAVAEERHLLADPPVSALNVALAKARATAPGLAPDEVVLGADTLVVLEGTVLGKPRTPARARAMLVSLRGRAHQVVTGVLLRAAAAQEWGAVVATDVRLRAYTDDEIEAYVARGEPLDKAGGYAIQDRQFQPVARLDGCYLNVVGLPLCAVARGLETLGVPPEPGLSGPLVPPCGYCTAGASLVQLG